MNKKKKNDFKIDDSDFFKRNKKEIENHQRRLEEIKEMFNKEE